MLYFYPLRLEFCYREIALNELFFVYRLIDAALVWFFFMIPSYFRIQILAKQYCMVPLGLEGRVKFKRNLQTNIHVKAYKWAQIIVKYYSKIFIGFIFSQLKQEVFN